MISDLPIIKTSVRSMVISTVISTLTSRVAAKSASLAAGTLITGLMYLPHNQVAKALTEALVARLWAPTYSHLFKVAKHPHKLVHHKVNTLPKTEVSRRLYLHTFEK